MRLLTWLTVLLAVIGVAALVLASRATAPPLTPAAAVSPSMNFAYVRVAGTLDGYPSVSPERDFASFRVRDASGDLRVSVYRSAATRLVQSGRLPMPGDVVTVEGTLRVREDEPSLVLNAAEALSLHRPAPQTVGLAALDALPLGQRATISGQVRRVRDVGDTLRVVTLRQGNAQADLLVPLNLQDLTGTPPELRPGDWITATGGVGEYRGKRQLLPARLPDVVVWCPNPLNPQAGHWDIRPISSLYRGLLGEWVAVQGQVTHVRRLDRGALIDLQDAEGSITIAAFDAWTGVPFSQTLEYGDVLLAQGTVIEYKGRLEIQAESAIDLVRLEARDDQSSTSSSVR